MKKMFVYDEYDRPIFEVTRTDLENQGVSCTFDVKEITAWHKDKKPCEDFIEDYLKMTIKSDSCTHITFGNDANEEECNLHFHGLEDYRKHIKLLHFLYNKAFELMGVEPIEGESWPEISDL